MWIRWRGPYVRLMLNQAVVITGASVPAPVTLRDVRKVHGRGVGAVVALNGVSAALSRGSFTAIMGPSGSGKSTFLNVAAGLDRPRPEVVFADEPTGALDTQNGRGVLALLREVVDKDGHTVVMVTHDPSRSRTAPSTTRPSQPRSARA
jgi:ABC-type lipoprotein export system ATPase subunit